MRNSLHQAQLHGFISQQAQGPAAVAYRGRRASQRRERRALRAIKATRPAATRGLSQGSLLAGFFVAAAYLTHGLATQPNGLTGRLLADAGGQG